MRRKAINALAAPQSAAAAEVKDAIEKNQIGKGERPTTPPPPEPPPQPPAPKPKASKKDVLEGGRLKRPAQQELPAMPKLDGVGKAARRMKDAIVALQDATDEKGEAEGALIAALKRVKRTSIQCDGFKFQFTHTGPKDKITVQKPK